MPSNVVHWYFAKSVYESLSDYEKGIAGKDLQAYLVGGQGPDLLFYMRYEKPPLNKLGEMIHGSFETAALFRASADYVRTVPEGETITAFLLGQLCHYALDSQLHPYIYYRMNDLPDFYPPSAKENIHVLFESSLDFLCVRDYIQVNPKRYLGYKNLDISDASREAVGRYYSSVVAPRFGMVLPAATAAKSLKLMRIFLRVCDDRTGLRYAFIRLIETLAGKGRLVSAFIRPRKEHKNEDWLNHRRSPVPKYKDGSETISLTVEEMAISAYEKAKKLIENFCGCLAGKNDIDESLYTRNYSGEQNPSKKMQPSV